MSVSLTIRYPIEGTQKKEIKIEKATWRAKFKLSNKWLCVCVITIIVLIELVLDFKSYCLCDSLL